MTTRITAIETAIPHHIMPNLLVVRMHTDAGVLGHGDTYYTPHAAALPNCTFQETVRAYLRLVYPKLIDAKVEVRDGHASLPTGTGLGMRFDPDLFDPKREGYRISKAST